MPFPLIETVPTGEPPVEIGVSASPSASVSFATTLIATGVSSFVETESLTAVGGSLTGVTVTLTVPVSVKPTLSWTV